MASSENVRLSVLQLEVTSGQEGELQPLLAALDALLDRKHYGRAELIRDEAYPLRFYVVQHWNDARSAEQCHADPEFQALTGKLYAIARVTHMVNGVHGTDPRRPAGRALPGDRRRRAESDRRSGFERRSRDVPGQARRERRGGRDRRVGPRRLRDRPGGVDLVAAARHAREHAEAAYSRFKVGAALEAVDGTVITGCNIENASYGLTMCAERVAMFKALSEGYRAFVRIAVVADTEMPTPPCGACRQILWEFGGNLEITLANLDSDKGTHRLEDLLPLPFDARLL